MKIKRTSQIILAVVIVLSLTAIGFALVARHFFMVSQEAYEARRIMFGFSDQLERSSDRLTTAVRAYAATGERRYYSEFQRELNVERNRDKAIEGLHRLNLTQSEKQLLDRLKLNSDKLIALEETVFSGGVGHDSKSALETVYGSEFVSNKAAIMDTIAECRRALEERFTREAMELAGRARRLNSLALLTLLLNAVTVLGVLVLFYRRRVVNPLARINQNLSDLIARKEGADIGFQKDTTEIGEVARSIQRYHLTVEEADRQRWVKTSVSEVADALQETEQAEDFGGKLLSTLVPFINAGYGAFHLWHETDGLFHFTSGYGFQQNRGYASTFAPGEGIAGQAVIEKKLIVLGDIPRDYIQIGSGLGSAPPHSIAAIPVMAEEQVLAVIEVASFSPFTQEQRTLLEEVASMVGMKLHILQRNLHTRELLEQVRLSEQRTRETEQFFRSVLELAPDGLMVADANGVIQLVNAQSEILFGFTREELIGKSVEMLVPEQIRGNHPALREGFHRNPEKRTMGAGRELLGQRKNGSHFPVEIGLSPIPGKEGEPVQVAISIRDITERKQAEEELRRMNFLADGALDLTKAGYWHVPLDGSGWYNSSERAARIFGDPPTPDHRYTLEHWTKHVFEGDEAAAKITMENFNAAVAGEIPVYDSTYAYKRPVDGQIVWIHALGRVVKDANGKPTDMFGVTQDITDFKTLEMELLTAKQKADEATLMKSMFLANMSHEIRTPMNAIIGLSYLALKTSLNPKQRDYLVKIHGAGTSLLTVINDILDFSKIEAGKLDIEETDFKLEDVITSVTTVTGQKAHEKGLEFLIEIPRTVPQRLIGDPLRLGQILTNLVNNAIKFTERGEVRIKAETVAESLGKCKLKFSVVDTGLGMTKEQTARLFQPFTQADMSTTRKHGGTGLGLTICKRLVELMDGEIWTESEPGAGSTFSFTVSLGLGEEKTVSKIVPERLPELNVLVVDDNSAAREIIQDALSDIVARVEGASSGLEAVKKVKKGDGGKPYDIIFMDWRMPGMDGLQAARTIKSDETIEHQPAIVMVTAFGREEVREEAEQLHLDGFLLKPITKSMLVDSLVTIFAGPEDESSKTMGPEDTVRFPDLRVLLTEDNEINQQIAVELLEAAGAKVDVANHGGEAIKKLFQGGPSEYDLVLMDLQMPEMDGYQATTRIRADSRFAQLPIIAMTAHATLEERQRCLEIGMNDHVSKPIDPAVLYQTISRFFEPAPGSNSQQITKSSKSDGDLPAMEGLDTKDGLSRVGGNHNLYLKLLRQFVEQQGPASTEIKQAIAAKNYNLAERIAHTVKGVAGSLGAREVQKASAILEKTIHENSDPGKFETVFGRFTSILKDFVNRLGAHLPQQLVPPSGAITLSDPEQVRDLVRKMLEHLNTFDPAATDLFESHRGTFEQLFQADTFATFSNQIGQFAFAGAMTTLEEAAKKKGILSS